MIRGRRYECVIIVIILADVAGYRDCCSAIPAAVIPVIITSTAEAAVAAIPAVAIRTEAAAAVIPAVAIRTEAVVAVILADAVPVAEAAALSVMPKILSVY